MLAVSIAWVFFLQSHFVPQKHLALTYYADNWNWTIANPSQYRLLLDLTQRFVRVVGVSIDYHKTWWWASSLIHDRLIASIFAELAPGCLNKVTSAYDFGFQMQYNSRNQLGILAKRIDVGLERISRLASISFPLTVKEYMLVSSIYPTTFHGAIVKPPSADIFHKLRGAAARALIGSSKTLSSAVALLFGSKGILDPEFWFVKHLLSAIRLFLRYLSPQLRLDFFWLASRFTGSLHSVHGPTASLGYMLKQIGWQINRFGCISVSAFLSFQLIEVSLARLCRFLTLSWQNHLVRQHTSRWTWFRFPNISVPDTTAVLACFADAQRKLLIRKIAGGYQLASQRKHWLPNETGKCIFCDAEDNRRHRLLDCPWVDEIRTPFKPSLDAVEEAGTCIVDFPVICVFPIFEALQLVHFRNPDAVWSPLVLESLHAFVADGFVPHFYTDGSC